MRLSVNGEAVELPAGATVADLLASRGKPPERVAVEVNLELVPRAAHAKHALAEGDRVEIVEFVGGG